LKAGIPSHLLLLLQSFDFERPKGAESRNPSEYDFEAVQEGRRCSVAYFFKGAHTHLKMNTEMENCCGKGLRVGERG